MDAGDWDTLLSLGKQIALLEPQKDSPGVPLDYEGRQSEGGECYFNEASSESWSTRVLERDINSLYYEKPLTNLAHHERFLYF